MGVARCNQCISKCVQPQKFVSQRFDQVSELALKQLRSND